MFLYLLYYLLILYLSPKEAILTLFLISFLPVFHHFRYGLVTYIPELSSALLLMSGVISFTIFKIINKSIYIYIGILLMYASVIFRMNFVVYVFFIFVFSLWNIRHNIVGLQKTKLIRLIFFFTILSGVLAFYFLQKI